MKSYIISEMVLDMMLKCAYEEGGKSVLINTDFDNGRRKIAVDELIIMADKNCEVYEGK